MKKKTAFTFFKFKFRVLSPTSESDVTWLIRIAKRMLYVPLQIKAIVYLSKKSLFTQLSIDIRCLCRNNIIMIRHIVNNGKKVKRVNVDKHDLDEGK